MRVMFKIVEEDPPTFRDRSKWSDTFVTFVTSCLVKDAESRPSIQNLLSHPFISGISDEEMSAVFKVFIQIYVTEQQKRALSTDANTLSGRKKTPQPPKAINMAIKGNPSATVASPPGLLPLPTPASSAAPSHGAAKKVFGWNSKKSDVTHVGESASSAKGSKIRSEQERESDDALWKSTEIRLKLSDSLKNMQILENLMKVLTFAFSLSLISLIHLSLSLISLPQQMCKPLHTWTHAEVYEWLIYLDTSPLHDKLRMKLIQPTPNGLTSSVAGEDLVGVTSADACLSILTEDVSLAEREQFVTLVRTLCDNISQKQAEAERMEDGGKKSDAMPPASQSCASQSSTDPGSLERDFVKMRSTTSRDGLQLKLQILSSKVESDAIQLGKEIVTLQEKA